MATSNFNLRGIAPEVMTLLKQQAKEQHLSTNLFIIKIIEEGIGYKKSKRTKYHDLDHLAGTWSEKEASQFNANTQFFEEIDEDLWS